MEGERRSVPLCTHGIRSGCGRTQRKPDRLGGGNRAGPATFRYIPRQRKTQTREGFMPEPRVVGLHPTLSQVREEIGLTDQEPCAKRKVRADPERTGYSSQTAAFLSIPSISRTCRPSRWPR